MTPSASNSDAVSDGAESPLARRGSQRLAGDDLEARLAAVVRLEHAGVLLGAGASVGGGLGGKTMASVWTHFTSQFLESAKRLRSENLVSSDAIVNVEALTDALEIARLEWQGAPIAVGTSRNCIRHAPMASVQWIGTLSCNRVGGSRQRLSVSTVWSRGVAGDSCMG